MYIYLLPRVINLYHDESIISTVPITQKKTYVAMHPATISP